MKLATGGPVKTKYNACPICGLPRGKGPHEFAHGKCAEERAKIEGDKKVPSSDPRFENITVRHKEKARDNQKRKDYRAGKLPKWMYE
jgi:hypothetical protein